MRHLFTVCLTRGRNKKGGLKSRVPNKCSCCNLAVNISSTTACSVWQGPPWAGKLAIWVHSRIFIFVCARTEWQFGNIKAELCWWPTVFVEAFPSCNRRNGVIAFLCLCSSARLRVGVVCCLFAISKWQLRNKKDLFALWRLVQLLLHYPYFLKKIFLKGMQEG